MKDKLTSATLIVGGLVLVFLIITGGLFEDPAVAAQHRQIDMAHNQQQAAIEARRAVTLEPWQTGMAVFYTLLPAALLLGGVLAVAYSLRSYFATVSPKDGLVPLPRHQVVNGSLVDLASDALMAHHQAAIAAAVHSQPTCPATLSYAPSFHNRQENVAGELEAGPGTLPTAQPMSQLLASGWRPTVDKLLLGYTAEGPLYCSLEEMLSVLIAGRPKMGKTTFLRSLYLQARMIGAQVIAWDIHASLTADLPGCESYTTPGEIDRSAQEIIAELDRRIAMRLYDSRADSPVFVMVDELPLVSEQTEHALPAARRLVLEGRKYGCFASVSGQGVSAKLFDKGGGALLKEAFSSRAVFWTSAQQARVAGLEGEDAKLVNGLRPGLAVVSGPVTPRVMAVPLTTAHDLEALPVSTTTTLTDTCPAPGRTSGDSDGSDVEAEIWKLLEVGGSTKHEIIRQVFGVAGGRRYQQAGGIVDQVRARFLAEHGQAG